MFKKTMIVLALGLFALIEVSEAQLSVESVQGDNLSQLEQAQTQDFQSYNFGRIPVNTTSRVTYTVTNTGTEPLVFKDAVVWGASYSARHSCAKGLAAKQKCQFTIQFWPSFSGIYSGRFQLAFTNDKILVDLWGEGYQF